jgi:tetratricopeptide (TPR) repeat protein
VQRCEDAIQVYEQIPDASPLRRNADIQIGNCLDALDRPDEAAEHISRVVDADPSDLEAVVELGNVFRGRNRFAEAAAAYSRGIASISDPMKVDWRIYYFRGVSLERSKRWAEAEADFKQALAINPNQPQVLNYLGYSWVDMGVNLGPALDMIKTAVDLRPNDGYIVDSLGWAFYKLGRYDEAVEQLERAVELRPEDPVINDHLGDAYWQVGRKREAVFQWTHARDLKPDETELPKIVKKIEQGLPPAPGSKTRGAASETLNESSEKTQDESAEIASTDASMPLEPKSVTVEQGDSLWTIADRVYGNAELYIRIFEANRDRLRDPDRIYPGMQLTLPAGEPN